ncbi:MAG: hypothetical protein JO247_12935, partial [Chloroflexi bacterium]|nr:hypothetical protein [Chloroflexota bacterium]
MNRRQFLAFATAAASSAVLAACGGTAAPASSSAPAAAPPTSVAPRPAGSAPAGKSAAGPYPTYAPLQGGPTPDFPSIGPLYEAGYANYPTNAQKSWTKDAPGAGGPVQLFVGVTRPAVPTPVDQNPAWQLVDKTANAQFSFIRPTEADYQTKLAAIMAGNDLPDSITFTGAINGAAGLPQFLQQACADLTPHLAADAAKDYPNLANLPTYAWKNTGAVVNAKLYLIPVANASGRLGSTMMHNATAWDAALGANYVPKSADDFKRVLQQLTKPSAGVWGTAGYQGAAYGIAVVASLFATPNNWALGSDGKLTKDLETSQYKEAVGYLRDLVAAGVFHPDSATIPDNATYGAQFVGNKFIVGIGLGFGGTWQQEWLRGLTLKPPILIQPIPPFPAHEGAKPTPYLAPGATTATALKKASDARIKEMLRLMDWLASPFGSQEDLLLTFGAADVDYKLDAEGHPVATDKSNADSAAVNWKTVMAHPAVAFAVGLPDFAKATVDIEHAIIPNGVDDPTWGYVAPTNTSKGVALTKNFIDGLTEVINGRRPLA